VRWLGRGVYHCCDYFWVSFAWDFCGCFGLYWIFFGFVSFYLGGGVWGVYSCIEFGFITSY
jgi:hypothetical protein